MPTTVTALLDGYISSYHYADWAAACQGGGPPDGSLTGADDQQLITVGTTHEIGDFKYVNQGFLRFDLSALPKKPKITAAELRLIHEVIGSLDDPIEVMAEGKVRTAWLRNRRSRLDIPADFVPGSQLDGLALIGEWTPSWDPASPPTPPFETVIPLTPAAIQDGFNSFMVTPKRQRTGEVPGYDYGMHVFRGRLHSVVEHHPRLVVQYTT